MKNSWPGGVYAGINRTQLQTTEVPGRQNGDAGRLPAQDHRRWGAVQTLPAGPERSWPGGSTPAPFGRLVLAFAPCFLVTGTTLAVPYLTKIAVDDYITAGDPGVAGLNRIFLALLGTQGLFGWPPTGRPPSTRTDRPGDCLRIAPDPSGNYSVWT